MVGFNSGLTRRVHLGPWGIGSGPGPGPGLTPWTGHILGSSYHGQTMHGIVNCRPNIQTSSVLPKNKISGQARTSTNSYVKRTQTQPGPKGFRRSRSGYHQWVQSGPETQNQKCFGSRPGPTSKYFLRGQKGSTMSKSGVNFNLFLVPR